MKETIVTIIAEILGESEEKVNAAFAEEGLWDSLKKVEIIFALEDEFGITFEQEEIAAIKTPQDILTIVETKS